MNLAINKSKLILVIIFILSINLYAQDLPPDGDFISYYGNGEIFLTGEVKNNKKHGVWEFFYENGKIQARERYNEGNPIGVWKTFYPNGRLKEKNDFRNISNGELTTRGNPYPGNGRAR